MDESEHANVSTEPEFVTLFDVARFQASDLSGIAHNLAFTYLNDGENVSGSLTYRQLDQQARQIAAHLQRFTAPGDRVLLLYPPGLDYIVGFYACIYAGVIAVPALLPANERRLPRLQLIVADAQPSVALSLSSSREKIERMERNSENTEVLKGVRWLFADELPDRAATWLAPSLRASDIVFLQYTSGSTGAPKGVVVSHANLFANLSLMRLTFGARRGDVFVSWLPPHHDMGLVGFICCPILVGGHSVQFPASAFLISPYRWLNLISIYRGRITGAPNFAYQLCAQRVSQPQKERLNLSCLDIAINGAERIRFDCITRFSAAFATCGLRPEVMTPTYGLAESVVFVSANMRKEGGTLAHAKRISKTDLESGNVRACTEGMEGTDIVSVGPARVGEHCVIVVDPTYLSEQPEEKIGEVWVSGDSVAQGYWGRPDAIQKETFSVKLDRYSQGWLRTGDLGFVSEGELYIIGRMKEMMIFSGRNVYPQDVESTIEQLDIAFRANGCAVFSLEDGDNTQLVVVQEVENRRQPNTVDLIENLRFELAARHDLVDVAAVLLVKPGRIPRTSSGKIQRVRCRQLYQSGSIDHIWSWNSSRGNDDSITEPQNHTERLLLSIWKSLFNRRALSTSDDFFQLGGHSLMAVQLLSRVRQELGVEVTPREMFAQPTVQGLARVLNEAKRSEQPAIMPVERNQPLPLSFAQQRLWFIDQLDPAAGAAYHIPVALRLQGKLDAGALRGALDRLVARHEVLRTRFVSLDGHPVQQIASADIGFRLLEQDLRGLPDSDREELLGRESEAEVRQGFDLSCGPLIRGQLLRVEEEEHILLLTQHHIISDGWSSGVLVREVSALYRAFSEGSPDPLPALQIQYADYAAWQRGWLQGEVLQRQVDYWQGHLTGAPALLELPLDRARPLVRSYAGDRVGLRLKSELTARLHQLAQRHGVTLFMVLLSAWSVLLAKLSGQSEVVIGTPVANRQRSEIESLIGFFVNMLALRVRLQDNPRVSELLGQIKESTLEGYAHQDIPFEQVVEALQPPRSLSHSPIFQALLTLDNTPGDTELTLPGLTLSALEQGHSTAQFDLSLSLRESGEGIEGSLEYASDLFERSSIERIAGYLQTLLEGMVADDQGRISELSLLSPAEREQLLYGFNDTAVDYPRDKLIHQLFEEQVVKAPDAIALVYEEHSLSYGQLNGRANQVAHRLRELGVKPDARVAICMERGLEMVVGLLGILKAGGAYVPLDPSYPAQRLAFMLKDSEPVVLLTQEGLRGSFPQIDVPVVVLDLQDESSSIARQSEQNLDANALGLTCRHLAYIIYTSGSTGMPKGVMVEHRNLTNLVHWNCTTFDVTEGCCCSSVAGVGFDAAVWEMFPPLTVGATLLLASSGARFDTETLLRWWSNQRLEVSFLPTPIAELAFSRNIFPSTLRTLLVGGDRLRIYPTSRSYVLINNYGPTESTVVATSARINNEDRVLHIGRPISNTQIYILDERGAPVPIGVSGEIYIGGAGVARGYLNRAELTAERFIADPFSKSGDARMYRTGDLGRWRADGNIEYLGRNDFQVKIRGFRIEVGEIEAQLLRHAGVKEAVVLAREDAPGDKRLIAYVVGQEGQECTAEQLRGHLLAVLPEYMVPSGYVRLERLPLTANGKLDRQALPAPDQSAVVSREYEAPQGEIEEAIAQIWQELLQLERVGREDNFFELGGHSLMAVSLIERLRRRGLSADVRMIFTAPRLAALAALMLEEQSRAAPGFVVPANLIPTHSEQSRTKETLVEFRL